MVKKFIFIMVWLVASNAIFANLPKRELVPGGVAIIPLPILASESMPIVTLNGKLVALVKESKQNAPHWLAVVGIPLTQTPGLMKIQVQHLNQSFEKAIHVKRKSYPTERLTLNNAKKATPQHIVDRLAHEKIQIDNALASWNFEELHTFQLIPPVEGRLTGLFGARRIINGEAKKPHRGIDLAAPKGTPIRAAATGIVVHTGHYLLTGKTVIVDHGQGFKTLYCHLNDIKIKAGEKLNQGDVLGTLGKTGRATGPHLHFGVSLNDERVSPELFFL